MRIALLFTLVFLCTACFSDTSAENSTPDTSAQDTGGADTAEEDSAVSVDTTDTAVADTAVDTTSEDTTTPIEGWDRSKCPTEISGDNVTWPETADLEAGGTRPVRILLEAVSFEGDFFVMRNVSGGSITFDQTLPSGSSTPVPWTVFSRSTGFPLPLGDVFEQDAVVTVYLQATGTHDSRTIYLGSTRPDADIDPEKTSGSGPGGEIAIYRSPDPTVSGYYSVADYVEALVRYGGSASADSATARDEAAQVGLWQGDMSIDHVPALRADSGIIAVGDVTTVAGWQTADVSCF